MEFDLKVHLKFSDNLPEEAQSELNALINDANNRLFLKGVPEDSTREAGKIIEWHLHANEIYLRIVSGRFTRSHDALIRFKKVVAKALGSKYHVGLRGYDVEDFIIRMEAEQPVQVKVPFISESFYEGSVLTLKLNVKEQDIERKIPDRIVNLIEDKIRQELYGAKAENWELMWKSTEKEMNFSEDPTEILIKLHWIKHGGTRGQWIYGPQITKIFRTFECIVVNEILDKLHYHEMIFPKLVPWEVWQRSGHAKGIYPEIYYVCTPKTRDVDFWEDVIDYYKITQEIPVNLIKEKIGSPIGGMCYAQCPSFYPFMQGETLSNDSLPIRVFDRSGTSHRYESGGIHGIERVDEFHRIEIVWIGTPEQVVEESKLLQRCYKHIFNVILDLEWRMAWVTPWFMAQEGMIGLAGDIRVGTIDYEAYMPYRGNRESSEWLEFQNLSVNGDKYPKGFNIKAQKGELWSGCSGVGLQRWASAFLAQKGFDPENWPKKFVKLIDNLPDVIKFL